MSQYHPASGTARPGRCPAHPAASPHQPVGEPPSTCWRSEDNAADPPHLSSPSTLALRAPPRAHAMLKQAREHHQAIVTIIRDWRPDLLEELVSDLSWPPRCSAPGPTRDGSTRRWPSRCSPAYHPGRWPQRQELARPLPRDRSARSWSGGRSAEHFKRRTTRERLSQPGQSRALAISLPAVSG
jgi:hypothetical protein